ncbi:site-specific integrase [Chryseobacterium defluvii]|uniref:Arm DNA-binding domain-containing protein n=1 Tax=Chryseobacterium defluvii TaxID=160396 RepID=A0A495SNV0_9FLAO|nr:phage integrase SAM-like domain-containing protein [Chryseobacterium defluvii]RKT01044.1 hypothetical protein BCF58_0255 [Chryseobacterium defluvii]
MLKHKVNFYINKSKKDLDSPVRAFVSFNSNRPELYTGITVKASEWDKEHQRIVNRKDSRNKDLDKIEETIKKIFDEFEILENRFPSSEELQLKFSEKNGRSESKKKIINPTFAQSALEYANETGERDSWTKSNYDRFKKLENHLNFYNSNLIIKNVTEKDLVKFVKYFQTEPINIKTGKPGAPHKNTTVSRTIKDVRTVLKWAKKKGFYDGDLHETFYPKFKGANFDLNEPIFMNWERLMKFYNHKFKPSEKHLEETRDIIAFCCFSSLRYSDVFALKKTQIRDDFFYVTTQKTTDAIKIDLNDYTKEILSKYSSLQGVKSLPVKSEKEINEQIKIIGSILEFDEPVNYVYFIGEKRFDEVYPFYEMMSSHIGRKTFIVNSLYLGIPAEVIMKWTGHKDYQSMKPYIAIVDDLKKSEMNKFNKK